MLPLPVKFTPLADGHVEKAAEWWAENRPSAPDALAENLADGLALISTFPQVGETARNVRLRDVRRVYLQQTGHYLYYRVHGESPRMVQVVAFWHSSRGSGPRI